MRNVLLGVLGAALLVLTGCANTPSTGIRQPTTARPAEQKAVAANNGAIFQAGQNERPLFEDRRARNVGDVITINIVEATTASDKSGSSAEHSGNIVANTSNVPHGSMLLKPFGVSGTSSGKLANKSDSSGNNTFSGTLTVTVTEVLPNGNLQVGGEKQVVIGQSNEYIRFSGVVNPITITGGNTVQSTQVADAHIEYKGSTNVDPSAVMSMMARVFLSVLPF